MWRRNGQRGIVIGPILFLIAIIGVLAAAIAAGTGGFSGSSSKSGAKVMASAILDYANVVQGGVDRVLANGCNDSQISFEVPFNYGHINSSNTHNPNAPSDKSCHVFDANGGGVLWKDPPTGANTILNSSVFWTSSFVPYFAGGYAAVPSLGTDDNELVLYLPISSKALCDAINNLLGINSMPTVGLYGSTYTVGLFTGAYTAFSYTSYPAGVTSACASDGLGQGGTWFPVPLGIGYFFYHVLKVN